MRFSNLNVLVMSLMMPLMMSLALATSVDALATTESDAKVSAAERTQLIDSLNKEVLANYVFPELADKIVASIRAHQKSGDYDRLVDPVELAKTLSNDLKVVSHDQHLKVVYSVQAVPWTSDDADASSRPDPRVEAARLKMMQFENFGFEKYERLDGNVAYLDLRGFFPAGPGGPTANAMMSMVANADGLIIDLRNNSGGDPEMVNLIASYLFDEDSVHLDNIYSRRDNQTTQFWTYPYVAGARYGKDKPVYLLTSHSTFSAGEALAYDLQALKRATVIGETTRGGANPGRWVRLDDHFASLIPTGRAINPITKTNWEGTGVHPDVDIAADLALPTAELMVMRQLVDKVTDPEFKDMVVKRIAALQVQLNSSAK